MPSILEEDLDDVPVVAGVWGLETGAGGLLMMRVWQQSDGGHVGGWENAAHVEKTPRKLLIDAETTHAVTACGAINVL